VFGLYRYKLTKISYLGGFIYNSVLFRVHFRQVSTYRSTPAISDDDLRTVFISSELTASIISSNVDISTISDTSTRYYMSSVTSSFEDMSVTFGTTTMTGNDVSTSTSDVNIISSSVFVGTSSILPSSDTTTLFAVGKLCYIYCLIIQAGVDR
jgi:hypothetical protein